MSLFPKFDLIWGMPVDYMHAVCLGIAKMLTKLWFDKTFSAFPWHIGGKLEEVDSPAAPRAALTRSKATTEVLARTATLEGFVLFPPLI